MVESFFVFRPGLLELVPGAAGGSSGGGGGFTYSGIPSMVERYPQQHCRTWYLIRSVYLIYLYNPRNTVGIL